MHAARLHNLTGISVAGPLLITPEIFSDERGFFLESWNKHSFAAALEADGQSVALDFVQDNHTRSNVGVLRGLHFQSPPKAQGKLVRCIFGEVFDVAVDCRCSSPTFGLWVSAYLSAANQQQLWVPEGFAHGFLVISDQADVLYKTTHFWDRVSERSVIWNDPTLAIDWPLQVQPVLAQKDSAAPSFLQLMAAGELFP